MSHSPGDVPLQLPGTLCYGFKNSRTDCLDQSVIIVKDWALGAWFDCVLSVGLNFVNPGTSSCSSK